jgi:hypothetical protein
MYFADAGPGRTNADINTTANPKTNPNFSFFIFLPPFAFIYDLGSQYPEPFGSISITSLAILRGLSILSRLER